MSGLNAKRIVVPVDFSDLSIDAVDTALNIVGETGSVDVIHVLPNLPAMEYGNLYGTVTDESRIKHVKLKLRERLSEAKHAATTIHVAIGDAGREIVAFAENEDADLIVMPSHGYGFVKHILLGSVAERVVRLAHCPVLVLRS
ncbi:UspA domain-containing protein [Rhodopirellula maiorica SM1]|uniref:UspA domain-containing protein n=1 Tax=Rhodopirellula maiorica SM1 TaxID=1265738 RepID=M5RGJ3_9BACT|nr:universal stress protein [Rhodopirellula maiorica]EMI18450.1 UspA domain-containing protein [Rhodopirellula maiorica SM1]